MSRTSSTNNSDRGKEEEDSMAGMYCNCHYENFSLTDVGKFERRLKKWCNQECMHGKSMLIFDKESLCVGGETTIEKKGDITYYKVVLPNITLVYTCVGETAMCIIHKIWENKTLSVLYNMPCNWDGTELWLCD